MYQPIRMSNFRLARLLVFLIAYLVVLCFPSGIAPGGAAPDMRYIEVISLICFSAIALIFGTHIAVLSFHESHFEVLCPLRPFCRKASYRYDAVTAIHFHSAKYPSVSVHFRSDSRRNDNWSIFADFRGGRKTMANLHAFLLEKGVEVKHSSYDRL